MLIFEMAINVDVSSTFKILRNVDVSSTIVDIVSTIVDDRRRNVDETSKMQNAQLPHILMQMVGVRFYAANHMVVHQINYVRQSLS